MLDNYTLNVFSRCLHDKQHRSLSVLLPPKARTLTAPFTGPRTDTRARSEHDCHVLGVSGTVRATLTRQYLRPRCRLPEHSALHNFLHHTATPSEQWRCHRMHERQLWRRFRRRFLEGILCFTERRSGRDLCATRSSHSL